eukprot:3883653-Alexandrium_andersonii.AAC.1
MFQSSERFPKRSELGAQSPARGAHGPSTPNGSDGPLGGSESGKVGDPHSAGPRTRGAARSAALLRLAVRQGGLRLSPIQSRGAG